MHVYQGTASEMARLINDTGVMGESFHATAKNVKEVPLDKMILGIHKVQEQLHITGTTAKEAETTLQGARNMMKAAWGNVQADWALGKLNPGTVKGWTSSVGTYIGQVMRMLKSIAGKTDVFISSFAEGMGNALPEFIKSAQKIINTVVDSIGKNSGKLMDEVLKPLGSAFMTLLTALLPLVIKGAINILTTLADTIAANRTEVNNAVVSLIEAVVNVITSFDWKGIIKQVLTDIWNVASDGGPTGLIVTLLGLNGIIKKLTGANVLGNLAKLVLCLLKFGGGAILGGLGKLGGKLGSLFLTLLKLGGASLLGGLGKLAGLLGKIAMAGLGKAAGALGESSPISKLFYWLSNRGPRAAQGAEQAAEGMSAMGNAANSAGPAAASAGTSFGQLAGQALKIVALGAGFLLAGIGLKMIADSAIAVANAGGPAIAVLFGMLGALAALVIIVAVAGQALTAGAVGFLAFGGMCLMIGGAVALAAAGLALLSTALTGLVKVAGDAFTKVLNALKDVIVAIGDSSMKSGIGMEIMAGAIKSLVALNLADLVATLAAVAKGMHDIGKEAEGITAVATGMTIIVASIKTLAGATEKTFNALDAKGFKWGKTLMTNIASGIDSGSSSVTAAMRRATANISMLASSGTASAARAALGGGATITQNVNINNSYTGQPGAASRQVTGAMKKSANTASTMMARNLAYARSG